MLMKLHNAAKHDPRFAGQKGLWGLAYRPQELAGQGAEVADVGISNFCYVSLLGQTPYISMVSMSFFTFASI